MLPESALRVTRELGCGRQIGLLFNELPVLVVRVPVPACISVASLHTHLKTVATSTASAAAIHHPHVARVHGRLCDGLGLPSALIIEYGVPVLEAYGAAHAPALTLGLLLRLWLEAAKGLSALGPHGRLAPECLLVCRFNSTDTIKVAPLLLRRSVFQPLFAAPEILLGYAPSAAADVFSLGAIVAVLACTALHIPGQPSSVGPFDTVCSRPAVDAAVLRLAGVCSPMGRLLQRSCAVNASKRPPLLHLIVDLSTVQLPEGDETGRASSAQQEKSRQELPHKRPALSKEEQAAVDECVRVSEKATMVTASEFAALTQTVVAMADSERVCGQYCGALWAVCNSTHAAFNAAGFGVPEIKAVAAVLTAHVQSRWVAQKACGALMVMAAPRVTVSAMLAAGCVDRLYAVMRAHAGCEETLALAIAALNNIATYPESVVASNGLAVLLTAMSAHVTSAGVQEVSCALIHSLLLCTSGQAAIRASKALHRVFTAMAAHPASAAVQLRACWVLRDTCVLPDGPPSIVSYPNGLQLILAVMRGHADVVEIQTLACCVLGRFAAVSNSGVVAANGIRLLYAVMDKHPKTAELQEHALYVLSHLCRFPESRRAVLAAGGVARIVSTMRSHMAVPSLLCGGCHAFRNISANDEQGKLAIMADGGVRVLRSALSSHPHVQDMQAEAVYVVSILVQSPAVLEALMRCDCMTPLMAVLTNFAGTPALLVDAFQALSTMATTASGQNEVLLNGWYRQVHTVMDEYVDSEAVQDGACNMLSNCATDFAILEFMLRSDGLRRIYRAMDMYPTASNLQASACFYLMKVSLTVPGVRTIASTDGLRRVSAAMDAHTRSWPVQSYGCAVMGNSVVTAEDRAAVVASGCVPRVLKLASCNRDLPATLKSHCTVIYNLSMNDSVARAAFIDGGALLLLRRLRKVHKSDVEFCAVADKAIDALGMSV